MSHYKPPKKEHIIGAKVTTDMKRKIDFICEKEYRTTASIIQQALGEYLERRKEEFQEAV